MKKYFLLIAAAGLLSVTGCKSSASAYQQAYEKAIQNDETTAQPTAVAAESGTAASSASDVSVRQEKVTRVSGDSEIRSYGVVCGSFSLKANADAVMKSLQNDGFSPVVALNEAGKTYRVIVASFTSKEDAAAMRDDFKKKYPDNKDFQNSWLLYNK